LAHSVSACPSDGAAGLQHHEGLQPPRRVSCASESSLKPRSITYCSPPTNEPGAGVSDGPGGPQPRNLDRGVRIENAGHQAPCRPCRISRQPRWAAAYPAAAPRPALTIRPATRNGMGSTDSIRPEADGSPTYPVVNRTRYDNHQANRLVHTRPAPSPRAVPISIRVRTRSTSRHQLCCYRGARPSAAWAGSPRHIPPEPARNPWPRCSDCILPSKKCLQLVFCQGRCVNVSLQ